MIKKSGTMCQMLRWALPGDLVLPLRVWLEFNRSRISEKIHYSESSSAGEKIKQTRRQQRNKPLNPKPSSGFLLFPVLHYV